VNEKQQQRYVRALHALQSGVAMEMQIRPEPTTPKHLRVGVNSAMCEHAGLVRLLVRKGVISEDEYVEAMTGAIEDEVARYEAALSKVYGRQITLG